MKILYVGLLLLVYGCSPSVTFPVVSNRIYANAGGVNDKSTFKISAIMQEARMKAYQEDNLFLKEPLTDTLFFLEAYNVQGGPTYGRIWNKKKSVLYSYSQGQLLLEKESIFSKYQISLIEKWDTQAIRNEEKTHGILDGITIKATRTFPKGKKLQIDKIYFQNFYKLQRDR